MNCFECSQPAVIEHHVVPFCLGGKRTVPLCEKCNKLAHAPEADLAMARLTRGPRRPYKVTLAMYTAILKLKGKMSLRSAARQSKISYGTVYRIWKGTGSVIQHYNFLRSVFAKQIGIIICMTFFVNSAFSLTANERKTLTQIQEYVRQGQVEYNAAMAAVGQADARANEAEQHAASTDQAIGVVKKQIDEAAAREKALAALNAKMKPVYDQCTSKWGIGAIIFGVKDLFKHLLVVGLILGGAVIALYILSFFFPLIGVFLAAIVGIFHAGFSVLTGMLKRIVEHLKPRPRSPIVQYVTEPPPPPAAAESPPPNA